MDCRNKVVVLLVVASCMVAINAQGAVPTLYGAGPPVSDADGPGESETSSSETSSSGAPGSSPPGNSPPGNSPPGSGSPGSGSPGSGSPESGLPGSGSPGSNQESAAANGQTGNNNENANKNDEGNDNKDNEMDKEEDKENSHKLPGYQGYRSRHLLCEGKNAELSCPQDTTIFIEYALWGRDDETTCNETTRNVTTMCDSGSGAVDRLLSLCDGKQRCKVRANINTFGDPCEERTNLYLVVEYSCRAKIIDALLCQSSGKLPLECPDGQVIQTGRAFWGRGNLNTTCPSLTHTPNDNCSNPDASYILYKLCDGKTMCDVDANTMQFGDPCPDANKYLSFTYTCEDCVNMNDDIDCETFAMEGECGKNPEWMYRNCRKACTKCGPKDEPVYNRYWNDTLCDEWAAKGDCETNPIWMMPWCKASCTGARKTTSCKNRVADTDCSGWWDDGECIYNVYWMFPNCTSSCFGCDKDNTDTIRCRNRHPDLKACDWWAAFGMCESNPGWMIPNCLMSCIGCEEDPVCENKFADATCNDWARVGECERNVVWMHQNCWKSCMQCDGAKECRNKMEDADCENWVNNGLVSTNPTYMTSQCWKTTSGCGKVSAPIADCLNTGATDTDCDFWSIMSECPGNPGFMYDGCFKSCSGCARPELYLNLVGNPTVPGSPLPLTAYKTVLMPNYFPRYARLTHFTVFTTNLSPVHLQLWTTDANGTLSLIYSLEHVPDVVNTAQTVKLPDCLNVFAGDTLGFSDITGNPSVAARPDDNMINYPHLMKGATNGLSFQSVGLAYKFSVGAGWSSDEIC